MQIYHAIFVGENFPYCFYLSVKTAQLVHSFDKYIIWQVGEESKDNKYWNRIKEEVEIHHLDIPSHIKIERPYRRVMEISDYERFRILEEYGGFYADSDTIAIHDILPIIETGKKDAYTWFWSQHKWDAVKVYRAMQRIISAHVVYAKRHSPAIKEIINMIIERQKERKFLSANVILGVYLLEHPDAFDIGAYERVNCFLQKGTSLNEDDLLKYPDKACIDHIGYAKHRKAMDAITPEWIKRSKSLYARTVRKILGEEKR